LVLEQVFYSNEHPTELAPSLVSYRIHTMQRSHSRPIDPEKTGPGNKNLDKQGCDVLIFAGL
jgi:hypothetical protein